MTRFILFASLWIPLQLTLTGCGGPSRPNVPEPELPDSAWPELSLLIDAVKPLRGGAANDETLILQVFQQAQLATHSLLEGDIPRSASGPETTRLLEELSQHQKSMRDFDQFSTEKVLVYFRTATALAEIAGLDGP